MDIQHSQPTVPEQKGATCSAEEERLSRRSLLKLGAFGFTALQRSSRASDNTPMHIRMDGPGYDTMDVPFNTHEPKLQCTMFVPTADFFATLRINQASLDLVTKYNVSANNNGLERFLTTTRRQNFLVPPRAHRAFPLAEL